LALYSALLAIGAEGYQDIVERNVFFAREVAAWMSKGEGSKWYEVLNLSESVKLDNGFEEKTVPLNIVLFRSKQSCPVKKFRPSNSNCGRELLSAINTDREVFLTPGPDSTIRIAVSNWMTGLGVNKDGLSDMEILVKTLKKVMVEQA
jgi:glutamate/tyrosine decarboxylase-like PLP-dependent enzyme